MNVAKPSVSNDALTTALASASVATAIATPFTALNHPLLQSSWQKASSAIAFIDASVSDYQTLVAGIAPGTEVHLLDSSHDAVTQITKTLLGRHNISSLHIVSHGEAGGLDFGSSRLNLKDLPQYAAQLQSWSKALTNDADILLYGCNVANGELGQAFVKIVSQLTGADVAASNNPTGKNGDWILEFNTGQIESSLAIDSKIRSTFASTLAISFGSTVNYATGGSFPRGLTFGDFDGDGDLDVFVSNETSNNVSLMTNNGSGVFTAGTPFSAGGNAPHPPAIANFDGVNGLDVAVPLYGSSLLGLLKSNGSGGFQTATTFAIGSSPVFAIAADFNKDGSPDVATANFGSSNVSVLLNNGSGGFNAATNVTTGSNPYSIAVADFNADGNLDMAVANRGTTNVSLLFGDGIGGFTVGTALTLTASPQGITTADFNDDGRPDLAIAATSTLSIRLNTGGGTFGAASNFSLGTNVFAVTSGDFNRDGRPDIAAVDRTSPNGTIKILENDGTGSFGSPTSFTIGNSPSGVVAADFNADGKIDLVTSNASGNNISVLLNTLTTTAPTLNTSITPVLSTATSSAAPSGATGTLVSDLADLVSISGGIDNVNDPDSSVTGIAIYFANNTNGNWWYSVDNGSIWNQLGTVSTASAKLLAANSSTRLYFQRNAGFNGTISNGLSFNVWDRSTGTNGGNANATVNGSGTPFSTASITIPIMAEPSANPVVSLPGGSVSYTENAAATLLDATATVADTDSANFNTGTLTVNYSANGTVDDRLAIRNQGTSTGQIGVSGNTVTYGGTTIGTFTGGTGTTALVVTFNASATPTAVSALLQNLTYANVSEAPSTAARTVRFVVTDGDGGTSTAATKTISVTAVDDTQFFVTNTNDSGLGSLRQAILDANADAGAETITFAGSTFTDTTPDTITLASGLTIDDAVTLQGTGAANLSIAGTGAIDNGFALFTVNAGKTASFSGLTFQDATYGIRNNGTIASFSNSAISNTRYEGINNSSTGTIALLTNSTISGVQLQGIYNGGTITTLSNTTISGNTSYGIYNDGTISTAVNNTIAANGTTGILNSGSGTIANLRNNLLVGNGTNTISGTITNQNTNLFGTFAEFNVDSVFKDNGGSTKTYALLPSSMAIDFDLSPGAPTTDQRGISRVGAVDIGAFESRGFTVAITGGNNQSTKVNTAFANPLTVTVSSAFNEPVAGGKINYVSNSSEIPIDPNAFFSGSPATLDSSGNASAIATANNYTGSYTIAVGGSGIATASFNLTNTPPNALPTSANKSVNFNEDTVYTFRTADFPFTDSDSGDTLQAVQITQLPTAGTGSLTLNGNTVNANDAIALADITSGKLKFTPFANAFGTNYTSFQFKVSDGNGFSSAAYTMALNVNAVDDTVFTVINTNDSGLGSLRQAVLDANADAGTENITFSLPTGVQTISLLTALPVLIESVNILNTTGAIGLTIRANTAGAFSLFSVALGQTVAFDQLTLSNGNSGIVNRGTIASLNNSILFGNTTGIANANGGTITSLSNSTISGNDTGVLNSSSTITSLSNSTISGNTTGISNSSGTITSLNNSTISGNTTGGIVNLNGTINTLSNSTISGNQDGIANVLSGNASATIGTLSNNTISGNTRYGIFNQGGTLTTVSNNTIAGNTTSSIANSGSLTTVFNNLLISNGDNSPTAPITVDASKNLRGTFANTGVDSTLRDNGGATQTHALLPNSVAINDGISTGAPTADQRGISRVGAVDIGAFESRGFTLAVTSGNNQSAVHNTAFNPLIVTVSSAFSEPVNGGTVFFDAPTTGASLADPAPPAVTIANGQVSLSPTANNTIGSYTVAASTRGGTNTATFSLTNTNTRPTVTTVSKMGTEDTTVSFSSADFTSQFSDANSDSLTKIQITSLSTKGILRLGSTAVSLNQELTAAQLSTLTYSPNANSNGADSFGWNGFDGAEYGTTGATVNLTIAAVNDAPTLTGNATLPAVTQNTTNPSGSTITTLFGSLFSDIDTGASLSGLAIVGNLASPNTQGQWQYSIDGLTWFGIGFVNDGTNALALTASTRVRFVPVTGYNGTPSGLSVRALDNTYSSGFSTNSNRVTIDTTNNGGSSAIAGGTPTTLDTSVVPSLPQLVWRNSSSGQNAVWQLNTFTVATSYFLPPLTDPNWQIAATTADFNQDGFVDLLWRNQRTGENAIWELNSTGYQTSYLITPIADLNWQIAGTADFNSDGTPDILWRNAATGQNSVWQQRGATLQSNYLLPTLAEAGWQLAATTADFNQDGVTDLLWRNQRTGANAIWQMNRTGYQTSAFITPVADTNWQIMGTGDFNRDGTADIVWRNKASGDNAIWQMQGATLQSGFLLPTVAEANWQIAGVADLGGDSTPELLWRNKQVGQTVLWQLNGFSYTTTTALPNLTDPNWSVKPFVAPLNPVVLNPVVAT